MKKRTIYTILTTLYFSILACSLLAAEQYKIPMTIKYQGYLTDNKGNPVNQSVNLIFRFYDDETEGQSLWEEVHDNVNVNHGIFELILGIKTPITPELFDNTIFAGIKIGNDSEIKPRHTFHVTPYSINAYHSLYCDEAKNVSSKHIENDSILSEDIKDNTITAQDIALNEISIDHISPNIISSINGISKDGENIDIVAGNNISILNDKVEKKISISANCYALDSPDNGPLDAVYVNNSGYVGIGTTNPKSKLSIQSGYTKALSGLVTVAKGYTTVTGTDTNFTKEVKQYEPILIGEHEFIVSEIINDSSLILRDPHPAGALGVNTYTSEQCSLNVSGPTEGVIRFGHSSNVFYPTRIDGGFSEIGSSFDDNFWLKTFDASPNPNFTIGIGDGNGGWAHQPIVWNKMLILNGSGQSWIPSSTREYGDEFGADMVIASNGNVGIGTNNPTHRLHIQGSDSKGVLVKGSDDKKAYTRGYKVCQGEICSSYGVIGSEWGDPNYGDGNTFIDFAGDFRFMNHTPKLTITENGKIGIGTTNPISQLHLAGSNNAGRGFPLLILDKIHNTAPDIVLRDRHVDLGSEDHSFYITNSHHGCTAGDSLLFGYFEGDDYPACTFNDVILVMNKNGNIGVGKEAPEYKLDVNGTIRGSNVSPSDIRLKKNIHTIKDALNKTTQLRGVNYEWKSTEYGEGKQMGVIAQEVEKVIPEVVSTDSTGEKSVEYEKMVGLLIEAVKELKHELDTIKSRVCKDHPDDEMCQNQI